MWVTKWVNMEYILSVDERGRITIPKEVRERMNLKKLRLIVDEDKLILEPVREDVVDKYYGIFKVEIKEDVDEILKKGLEELVKND